MRVRCDLAQHRDAARESVDVVHREIDPRFVGCSQQVQDGVRRTSHGDVERHGVLEGRLGGDRARQHRLVAFVVVACGVADDELGRRLEEPPAVGVRGQQGSVARQGEPQGLGQAVHRIGGKHSGTRTASGAGPTFDFLDICIAATAVCTHDHGVDQIYSLAVEITGFHRASGYKNRRNIQTHSSHQHARSDFVTITDTKQSVYLMGVGHVFHTVGDDFPRRKRV